MSFGNINLTRKLLLSLHACMDPIANPGFLMIFCEGQMLLVFGKSDIRCTMQNWLHHGPMLSKNPYKPHLKYVLLYP